MGLGVQSFNSPPPPPKKKTCVNNTCWKVFVSNGMCIFAFSFCTLSSCKTLFAPPVVFFPSPFSRPHLQLTQDVINTSCLVHAKLQVLVEHPMVKVETQNGSIYIYIHIYIHIPLQTWLDGHTFPYLTLPASKIH